MTESEEGWFQGFHDLMDADEEEEMSNVFDSSMAPDEKEEMSHVFDISLEPDKEGSFIGCDSSMDPDEEEEGCSTNSSQSTSLSPSFDYTMEPDDEEGFVQFNDPDVENERPIIKKRRRKKKTAEPDSFLSLPEDATQGLSPEIIKELQESYNIFQMIMNLSVTKIKHFLEKPDETLYGMSGYYKTIKNPMWLCEVQRKILGCKYSGVAAFVADIRLILENCFRFWGYPHKFTRKALSIEQKLEQCLSTLPQAVQDKCSYTELNADEVIVKTENTDEQESKESLPLTVIKGFESKILRKVLDSHEPEETPEYIEEQKQKESEWLSWETTYLVNNDTIREQIKSMWQLAEIGSFLKLTWESLNIEEIPQYEVERMLLMPRESTTLATLMTSMLTPPKLRSQLDVKPVMPYEVWTTRLKKKIDSWLNTLYKTGDEFMAFTDCGVEPHFWYCIGLMNPLERKPFHEIPFYQRVWIMKSLCNYIMHINKPVQEVLMDVSNLKELKPIRIGGDKRGNVYFRIPFYREIRVYKQTRLRADVFGTENEKFIETILNATSERQFNDEDQMLEFLPCTKDCTLIADSVDSLLQVSATFKQRKQELLSKAFSKQWALLKEERQSVEGLIALFTQWQDYQNRSTEYFTNQLNQWYMTEKPKRFDKILKKQDGKDNEILGKRQSKKTINFFDLNETDSSEENSSDVSDWESTYKNKNKKKGEKEGRGRRRKRKPSITDYSKSESDVENKEEDSCLAIEGVVSLKDEIDIDIKPFVNDYPISNMKIEESPILGTALLPNHSEAPNISVYRNPVKEEKEDVIYISSDEEKEMLKRSKMVNNISQHPMNVNVPRSVSMTVPAKLGGGNVSISVMGNAMNKFPQTISVEPVNNMSNGLLKSLISAPIQVPKPVRTPSPQKPTNFGRPRQLPQSITIVPKAAPDVVVVSAPERMPMPIPSPATRHYPLPIPEPAMPQPILVPTMPQPLGRSPAAWSSPRGQALSPRGARGSFSPRLRSPSNISPLSVRTPSPRGSPLGNLRGMSPSTGRPPFHNPAARNLFPTAPGVPTVEGVLEIGQKSDGSYGYHVRLPDGGVINMNRNEIDDIRRKNNGVLPVKVEVPLTKNKKF